MKKILFLLGLCYCTIGYAQRNRHVAKEWNSDAVNIEQSMFSGSNAWHVSPWLGAYYQTDEWWVYHCNKGWMYPESDSAGGVWLYWPRESAWIWTNRDVYPLAFNLVTDQWFNFCSDALTVAILN
jgi:hypothetical protein